MRLKWSRKGVSPVIGVILMVAITVILAAVIASFVFGMSSKVKSAPQAQFMLEDAPQPVTQGPILYATLYGGEKLKCSDIRFQLVNTSSGDVYTLDWNGTMWVTSTGNIWTNTAPFTDGFINIGDVVKFIQKTASPVFEPGTTVEVRVIHVPTSTVIYDGRVTVQ